MRRVKDIKEQVLARGGRFREVCPESSDRKKPAPLKVKEVIHDGKRYIVCLNPRQARKDAADRRAIIDSLQEQLKKGAEIAGRKQRLSKISESQQAGLSDRYRQNKDRRAL